MSRFGSPGGGAAAAWPPRARPGADTGGGTRLALAAGMAHRLLVVDDEDPILFAMREYFTTCGYMVDCAREMEEAEAMLLNADYAAVIADLRLTGSHGAEGLELIGHVRDCCPRTRIVLLTAYGSSEVESEARRRGVDAFLHKPMPLPAVAQIVRGLLQS